MNLFDCAIKREEGSGKSYEKLAAVSADPELKTSSLFWRHPNRNK
ncbi:MAG: hypothetical protein PHR66_12135 [Desulfuromonadaceae bacterium]|nr:hypothetical protein [Desulfuromonadaceae bacterium]